MRKLTPRPSVKQENGQGEQKERTLYSPTGLSGHNTLNCGMNARGRGPDARERKDKTLNPRETGNLPLFGRNENVGCIAVDTKEAESRQKLTTLSASQKKRKIERGQTNAPLLSPSKMQKTNLFDTQGEKKGKKTQCLNHPLEDLTLEVTKLPPAKEVGGFNSQVRKATETALNFPGEVRRPPPKKTHST